MTSAPARRKHMSASSTTARSSIQPRSAAAFIIAYSPETWYADRQVGRVLEPLDDVEVRHARLDHEHVRALGDVELGLDERLARVGGVLLVRLLVRRRAVGARVDRVRVERVAEGAVERAAYLAVYDMIDTSVKPSESSAMRSAPTRPSIMSDGPITSVPARAWHTACLQSCAIVTSFAILPSMITPSWPIDEYGSSAMSVHTIACGYLALSMRTARHDSSGLYASSA